MQDTTHYTDAIGSIKRICVGAIKTHWVEFQLVDEQGVPLAGLPFRAVNQATRAGICAEYQGQSDTHGVIRLEGLHQIQITLTISANPLVEMCQQRRLRAVRAEPRRPGFADPSPLYGPQRDGFSPIEQQALAAGHGYHYLRVGQLCDEPPVLIPEWPEESLPAYHFPDRTFAGFTLEFEQLDQRNILEVCPFRAWSLVLHHQAEYSLANAYNLGLMSILAYSREQVGKLGSAEEFFLTQCLDLSRTPKVWDSGQAWPSLVKDVPFSGRYDKAQRLDTAEGQPPEGDTQLFYAISATQVLVSWRGTETGIPAPDLITDLTFRPVTPEISTSCHVKVDCPDLTSGGKVHLGFRNAFTTARAAFPRDFNQIITADARSRDLYICGHSLGGALGLIHAASIRDQNPLLYTYGMPRTFTLKAVQTLKEIKHFRHVNARDLIPEVPPEADLDNWLIGRFGRLGTLFGFQWSLRNWAIGSVFGHDDPYVHHGEVALLHKAEQHQEAKPHHYTDDVRTKESGYRTTVAWVLPRRASLYLVPSISEADDQALEQIQGRFCASLCAESKAKLFPPNTNVKVPGAPNIFDHFMKWYQPNIHNQLLESISPERMVNRIKDRQKFIDQMEEYRFHIPADELERDRLFLDLHNRVGSALRVTRDELGGTEALERFDSVADPNAYFEFVYGGP